MFSVSEKTQTTSNASAQRKQPAGTVRFKPPAMFPVQREKETGLGESENTTAEQEDAYVADTDEITPDEAVDESSTETIPPFNPEQEEDDFYEKYRDPIDILGETHHIAFQKANGEWMPGISSDWADVDEIYQELRRMNLLGGTNLGNLRTDVRTKYFDQLRVANDVTDLNRKIDALMYKDVNGRRVRRVMSSINERRLTQLRASRYDRSRTRDLKMNRLNGAIRAFIHAAVQVNSTVVAEVLGASMPAIVFPTDVVAATAANTYRYHTGALADPIPLTWYKPAASYANLNVNDYATGMAVATVLQPGGGNGAVQTPNGNAYTFNVTPANFGLNQTWRNVAKHGSDRAGQRALNGVLNQLDYDLAANNEDGDHVRDLGFGGADNISNYWPLNSVINRLAFNGWRNLYRINYKKRQLHNGNWELEKAPLNSGSLVGKYFTMTAENAVAVPQAGVAAGSSTAWGAAGTMLATDGTPIAEG